MKYIEYLSMCSGRLQMNLSKILAIFATILCIVYAQDERNIPVIGSVLGTINDASRGKFQTTVKYVKLQFLQTEILIEDSIVFLPYRQHITANADTK